MKENQRNEMVKVELHICFECWLLRKCDGFKRVKMDLNGRE